ncbi:MAG: T9SS type A sorting domain-containing protein [Bacteroidota bacterium]
MKTILTIAVFLISYCINAQWNKVNFSGGIRTYTYTISMSQQGADTIFCARMSSASGNPQGIFYSVDGGKNFTFYYDLLVVWGWVQHMRFIDNDTLLIVTSKGVLKKSSNSQDLPFYTIEYADYDTVTKNFSVNTHFWNNSNGLIVSSNTFRTFDGGRNWTVIPHYKTINVGGNDLEYIASSKRFISNNGNRLFESKDFGNTWDSLYTFKELLTGFSFVNNISFPTDSIGYATAGKVMYKTLDGGKSWDTSYAGSFKTLSMVFADRENGFVLFENFDAIYRISNDGNVWKQDYALPSNTQAYSKFFYLGDSAFFLNFDDELYLRSKLALNIEQQALEEIVPVQVYPNPFSHELTVKIPQGTEKGTIEIRLYNLIGELVQTHQATEETTVKLNTSDLPRGFYIAKFSLGANILVTQKLIKQ